MEQVNSPWGLLPKGWRLSTIDEEKERLTDYVANGSFASLASNVHYKDTEDYAVLIRLVDFNNDFKGPFVYIDEHAYNFLSKSSLSGGEIIISNVGANVGTIFKCPNLPYKMSLAPNAITIKLKGDNDFYYYWFKSKIGQANIQALVTGSAQPKFNKTNFRSMYIPVPPLATQRRIASILSSLDRKIELNDKINADLEEMAQAIFKNWFVDFEPFKDGKFVDSELGMIPEGWKVGSLGDFCNVFTGKKNTNQAIEKGLYPFFSCAPEPLASNDAIFNGKAIIIAGNGSYTGRTSFYNGGFDLYQRTYACTIREQDKENLMIFFYHMMKQFFEPTKMGGTRGSSIPYIVMGDITQQKFPYSEDWLIRFSNIANSMMDRKLRIDKENSRLSLLRDTLLPRLMSGELEVPE